jgi:hypothetical protein
MMDFSRSVDQHLSLRMLEVKQGEALCMLIDANSAHLRRWLYWVDANTNVDHTADSIQP